LSNEAINWAFSVPVERSSDRLMLVCLANYANLTGYCYPSQAKVIADTLLDRKTVIARTKRLVERGLIVDTGKRKGSTGQVIVYRLELSFRSVDDAETVPDLPSARIETVPIFPPNSPVFPIEESQYSHETVPKTGHGTPMEPSGEPPGEPPSVREPVDTDLFGEPVASKALPHIGCHDALSDRPPKREQAAPQGPALAKPAGRRDKAAIEATPECLAFWHAYPRKRDGLASALPAWAKAIKRASVETIMAGLARFPFSADPSYQPMAATWLNRSQWGTEADTAPQLTVAPARDRRMQGVEIILGRPIVGLGMPEARGSPAPAAATVDLDLDPGDWNER
jgi:hypothetical protein